MGYPWQYKNLDSTTKHIIDSSQKNEKLLKESHQQTISNNEIEKANREALKEIEKQKQTDEIIKKLEDLNKEANKLMNLISEYIDSKDDIVKEKISINLKKLKENLQDEYKKHNKAKCYENQIEKAFYIPAIRDAWVSISSFQYTRKPCQAMYSKVYDVADYATYYLTQLKSSKK